MHPIRKLVLVGLVALTTFAVAAPAATAVEVRDATTGTALAVGDSINGLSTTVTTIGGTWFGVPWSLRCNQSSFVASLTANAPAPAGNVTSLSFSLCATNTGNPCSYAAINLPWALSFPSATQMSWTIPSNGGWWISGTNCLPLNSTCTFGGGQTLNYTWANVSGGAGTATLNQTVTDPTCGSATWTATYAVRRGSTIGSGNGVQVV